MGSDRELKALLKEIHDAVVAFEEEKTADLCRTLLETKGVDPYDGVIYGLAAGMDTVGGLYERKEYFVPELLLCSDALYAGLAILKPHIRMDQREKNAGKIVMGVVEGDIHDIGKNLLKTMFEAAGWEIFDLGKDVKLDRFVEEQQKTNADVVALSALMTTSMLAMPKVIGMLRDRSQEVKILVGGAPMNKEIAEQYGADGYAPDAVSAVEEAVRLIAA